ncbi:hypothetical protein CWY19_002343, partial [Salmonella enterica subsp. enterica serovar Typhimurium var. 5-]|nr:hypothetical protein [Salmonella enterica subsp. enterica serovar Typhimurium var. 5-]
MIYRRSDIQGGPCFFPKPDDTGQRNMSKIFDFVKPGVITGDDVQKVFQVAK